MTDTEIETFSQDFREKTGIDLANCSYLRGDGDRAKIFINRVELIVYQQIKHACPGYVESELEPPQITAIWDAMLEQAYYMIENYDMFIMGGIDPVNNAVLPIDEIRKRAFSKLALDILTDAGLQYHGMQSLSNNSYNDRRRYWG